jgi:hypothetical protein
LDLIFSGNKARVSPFENRAACVPSMFSRSAYFLIERGRRFGLNFFTQNRKKKENVKKKSSRPAKPLRSAGSKPVYMLFLPVRLRSFSYIDPIFRNFLYSSVLYFYLFEILIN